MAADSSSRDDSRHASSRSGERAPRSSGSGRGSRARSWRWIQRPAPGRGSSSRSREVRVPEASARVRIAIADDHQIFRDGLRRLLESEPGFKVVAEGADGTDAVRIARDVRPDVLLLDVAMPRMGGIEALAAPDITATRVIVL